MPKINGCDINILNTNSNNTFYYSRENGPKGIQKFRELKNKDRSFLLDTINERVHTE
jgi:hypothetical protein